MAGICAHQECSHRAPGRVADPRTPTKQNRWRREQQGETTEKGGSRGSSRRDHRGCYCSPDLAEAGRKGAAHLRHLPASPAFGRERRPMAYEATLQNAKPPGKIRTTGSFGPWDGDDPGQTPVSGSYDFQHADLSDFHGIPAFCLHAVNSAVAGTVGREWRTDNTGFCGQDQRAPRSLEDAISRHCGRNGSDTFLEPVTGSLGVSLVAQGK